MVKGLQRTPIEWVKNPITAAQGYSWNPVTGCSGPNSKGPCPYCYAKRLAETRLRGRYGYPEDVPFHPTWHQDKIDAPLKKALPSGIFTVDMGDLFGRDVPREWIQEVLLIAQKRPLHIFYMLTKNPKRYQAFVDIWPENAWAGTTVDKCTELGRLTELRLFKHKMAEERNIKPIIFASMEPMLTPMTGFNAGALDWLIIGGLSRSEYREPGYAESGCPPKQDWVEEILREADNRGTPVFMKRNLPYTGERREEHPLFPKQRTP